MGDVALWQRSGEELLEELRAIELRMRQEYAASLELIAELDARNVIVECGYPTLAELLRDVLRITRREAKRRIEHTRAVAEVPVVSGGTVPAALPVTAEALREGDLGADHVDVIARALSGLPSHVPDEDRAAGEATLVTAARSMDARTLDKVAGRLRAVLDQDGAPPDETELAEPVNELHLTTRANGRAVGRFELDREASALLQSLLSPLAKPRPSAATGPNPRTPAERNGDALVEILQLAADSADVPSEAGARPQVVVTVPLRDLRTGIGSALLDGVGHLDAAAARRIACDCKLIPAVLGAHSEPLDVGRSSYTVTSALRRALILQDRGCAFPGCDRPPRQCHAHHIRH